MNLPIGNQYGLIAQDVEQVLPNLVKDSKFVAPEGFSEGSSQTQETLLKQKETIDFKAVNYTELIPIIIKGMQEQQKQLLLQQLHIELQNRQIEDLKNIINKLAT